MPNPSPEAEKDVVAVREREKGVGTSPDLKKKKKSTVVVFSLVIGPDIQFSSLFHIPQPSLPITWKSWKESHQEPSFGKIRQTQLEQCDPGLRN